MADPLLDNAPAGAALMQRMIDGGAPPEDVHTWQQGMARKMIDGGAPIKGVMNYWGQGEPKAPDMSAVQSHADAGHAALTPEEGQKVASSPLEHIAAGLQMSSMSLLTYGKPTMIEDPSTSSFLNRMLSSTATMVGDAPATLGGLLVGGSLGSAAGEAAGSLGGPGSAAVGGVVGGVLGAGAMSAALPEAIRSGLMEMYRDPAGPKDWASAWAHISNVLSATGKAAIVGAASLGVGAGAGKLASGAARPLLGDTAAAISGTTASIGSYGVAAASVGAALEGKVPEPEDIALAVATGLGAHVALAVKGATQRLVTTPAGDAGIRNLQDIYVDTGLQPKQLGPVMAHDNGIREEVMAPADANGQATTPLLDQMKLDEPKPFTDNAAPEPKPGGFAIPTTPTEKTTLQWDENNTGHAWSEEKQKWVKLDDQTHQDYLDFSANMDAQWEASLAEAHVNDEQLKFVGDPGTGEPPVVGAPKAALAKAELEPPPENPSDVEKTLLFQDRYGNNVMWSESKQKWVPPTSLGASDRLHMRQLMEPPVGLTDKEPTAWWHGSMHAEPSLSPSTSTQRVKAVWAASSPEISHEFIGYGSNQTISRIYIKAGKYFDFRDPSQISDFTQWMKANFDAAAYNGINKLGSSAASLIKDIRQGHYTTLQDTMVQKFLEANGYEGYFEREHSGTPVNLAVYSADKIIRTEGGTTRLSQQLRRLKHLEVPPEPTPADQSKAGTLTTAFVHGEPLPDTTTTAALHAASIAHPPGGGGAGGPPIPPGSVGTSSSGGGGPGFVPSNEARLQKYQDFIAKPDSPGFLRAAWSSLRGTVAGFQSKLTPAYELDTKLDLSPRDMGIRDWIRMTYGSKERTSMFIQHGGMKWTEGGVAPDANTPSWRQAFQEVKEDGGNSADFYAYRAYARTVEKAGQDVDTGLDINDAIAHVSDPANRAMYERGAKTLAKAKDGMIDYVTDSGVWSPERAQLQKDLNRYHISFRRVSEDGYNPLNPTAQFSARQPTKTMKGSEKQIVDPALAEIDNAHTLVGMADRNRMVGNVLDLLTNKGFNAGDELGLTKLDIGKELGVDLDSGAILNIEILDETGKPVPDAAKEGLYPFLAERAVRGRMTANDFTFWRNGKMEIWRAKDPQLAELVKSQPLNWNSNAFVKILNFTARLARAGITADPTFAFRSATHGQLAQAVAVPNGGFPFASLFQGLAGVLKQEDGFKDFMRNGGGGAALGDTDRAYIAKDLANLDAETGFTNAAWNVVRHPLEALGDFQHLIRAAAGYGYAKRGVAAGLSPIKASMESRTALLDHAEGFSAAWVNQYAKWTPFMDVGFKDIEQVTTAFRERWLSTVVKGAAYISIGTFLNAAYNLSLDDTRPDNEKYINMPRWLKQGYWVLPADASGASWKVKKPWVINAIFAEPMERFAEFLHTKDPVAFKGMVKSMAEEFLPPFMPTLAQPIVEQATNTRAMSGAPLIPAALEANADYMRYGPDTTLASQKLSRILGSPGMNMAGNSTTLSPIALDNYMRQWGGTLPYQLAHALDAQMKPASARDIDWSAFKEWPIIRAFTVQRPEMRADVFQDLHEQIKKITEGHADLKHAEQTGDLTQLTSQDLANGVTRMRGVEKIMSGVYKGLDMIANDKDMTRDEKRKQTAVIMQYAIPAAHAYAAELEQFEQSLPK